MADEKKVANKTGKGNKKVSEFFKGLKSDIKKINWPTFKMVLKSTGVVLFVVILLGLIIFAIDQGMTYIIKYLDKLIDFIVEKIGKGEASTAASIASMLMM